MHDGDGMSGRASCHLLIIALPDQPHLNAFCPARLAKHTGSAIRSIEVLVSTSKKAA
jgi:hypothetical protein